MSIRRISLSLAAALAATAITAPQAHASFIIDFEEVGGNVVATGSGTLNTSALTLIVPTDSASDQIEPSIAEVILGSGDYEIFEGISGPGSFGLGGVNFASTDSGSIAAIDGGQFLAVPVGYTSGDALSDSATWDDSNFSMLYITPGTYTWTWGSDGTADSFTTIFMPETTTPEPASLTLFGIGVLSLALLGRRRRVRHSV